MRLRVHYNNYLLTNILSAEVTTCELTIFDYIILEENFTFTFLNYVLDFVLFVVFLLVCLYGTWTMES